MTDLYALELICEHLRLNNLDTKICSEIYITIKPKSKTYTRVDVELFGTTTMWIYMMEPTGPGPTTDRLPSHRPNVAVGGVDGHWNRGPIKLELADPQSLNKLVKICNE